MTEATTRQGRPDDLMEPARSIIRRLGGEAVVARVTEMASTAPYRWQYDRSRGGTGGLIPQRHHPTLLSLAKSLGVALSAEDFLPVSAKCSAAADDSSARALAASADPKSQISELPRPAHGPGDHVVTPSPVGG